MFDYLRKVNLSIYKMTRRATLISLLSLFTASCATSWLNAQEGRSTLHFLSLPATTKTMALGGVTTTIVANDAALALESPALFGIEQSGQLSMSYMNYLSDTHIGTVFYTRQLGSRGAWGVGARFIDYGKQEERDTSGAYLSTFGAKEVALQASYSYELTDYLRAGVSIKGLFTSIANYSAWGLGADLGINYFSLDKERSVGLSVVNIGSLITPLDDGKAESLPWDIRLGYSQKFAHAPFQLHITAYNLRPRQRGEFTPELKTVGRVVRHLALGVEYMPSDRFWIGLGYSPRIAQDYNELRGGKLAGLSLGVGFDSAGYRAAVSASSYGGSFWAFMATFSTDFGLINRL